MAEIIGRIWWTAVETATGESTCGETAVRLEDVSIEEIRQPAMNIAWLKEADRIQRNVDHNDPESAEKLKAEMAALIERIPLNDDTLPTKTYHRKSLVLGERFRVSMPEYFRFEGGFGLTFDLVGERNFGWDWFNRDGQDAAKKLQESGSLRLEHGDHVLGRQITQMRFETDVSLRLWQTKPGDTMVRPELPPMWRLRIDAGSEMFWPSLVDGVVVATGTIS